MARPGSISHEGPITISPTTGGTSASIDSDGNSVNPGDTSSDNGAMRGYDVRGAQSMGGTESGGD